MSGGHILWKQYISDSLWIFNVVVICFPLDQFKAIGNIIQMFYHLNAVHSYQYTDILKWFAKKKKYSNTHTLFTYIFTFQSFEAAFHNLDITGIPLVMFGCVMLAGSFLLLWNVSCSREQWYVRNWISSGGGSGENLVFSITHCGLLMPYGDLHLGQHWLG